LVSETAPSTIEALRDYKVPIVLLDREVEGLSVAGSVLSDHYAGVRDACASLLSAGHRRIALVTGTPDVRSTRERVRAMEEAFAAAGETLDEGLLCRRRFDADVARAEVIRLLSRPDAPTAILTGGVDPTIGTL